MKDKGSTKFVLRSYKTIKTIFGHVWWVFISFLCSIFFYEIENHLLCSLSAKIWVGLGCQWVWYFKVRMTLSPNLGEGVLGRRNYKNCSFLNQSVKGRKFDNISKDYFPMSIRWGDTAGFPLFDLEKRQFHLYLRSKLR